MKYLNFNCDLFFFFLTLNVKKKNIYQFLNASEEEYFFAMYHEAAMKYLNFNGDRNL